LGGATGQNRDGEKAGPDDSQRKDREGEFSRDRSQGLGRLRRRLDIGDPMRIERRRRRQDDEQRDEIGEAHADDRIQLYARQLSRRLPRRFEKSVGRRILPLIFYFRRRLPEEKVRADGRSKHGDHHSQVAPRPLDVRTTGSAATRDQGTPTTNTVPT
jgi:hypothetical protein